MPFVIKRSKIDRRLRALSPVLSSQEANPKETESPPTAKYAMSGPPAIGSANQHQLTGILVTLLLPLFVTQILLPSKATPNA